MNLTMKILKKAVEFMKKELFEAIKNLEMEKVIDFIDKEVKEAYINSFLNSSFQGWMHRIVLEPDGNIFISGSMSNNTIFQSMYDGDSIELGNIPAWQEIEGDVITFDDIAALTEEEKNDLWINIEGECGFESLKEQVNEFQEKFDLEYICNNNMSLIESSFNSLFSEKYEELQKRYVEAEWDNYVRDSIVDEIYDKIIEIREAAETDEEE